MSSSRSRWPSTARRRPRWSRSPAPKGVFFAEALWTYFLPKFDVLQQIFDAGVLGEIKSVHTDYGEYFTRDHRIFDPRLAGGPLLDLGTYPVSLLAKLLGVPRQVIGLGAGRSERRQRPALGDPDRRGRQPGHDVDDALWLHAHQRGDRRNRRHGALRQRVQPARPVRGDSRPTAERSCATTSRPAGISRDSTSRRPRSPAASPPAPPRRHRRPLQAHSDTMAALDMIRAAVGIKFSAARLVE